MVQTQASPLAGHIETLHEVLETIGSAELGRRAEVAEATVRSHAAQGFRTKPVRNFEAMVGAALAIKAERAER